MRSSVGMCCVLRSILHGAVVAPPAAACGCCLRSVQLLACHPQRLLAAACALAKVLPGQPKKLDKHKHRLFPRTASSVAVLTSHRTLSTSRLRGWLAPPPPMAAPAVALAAAAPAAAATAVIAIPGTV